MKIQKIANNQCNNNISHKAYFEPNRDFKKLWAVRPKDTKDYLIKMQKVKGELPNHQLEIIDSGRWVINEKLKDCYLIFNNMTNKSFGLAIAVDSVKNHFEEVLDSLLEKNEYMTDFFKSTGDTLEFNNITTKNF